MNKTIEKENISLFFESFPLNLNYDCEDFKTSHAQIARTGKWKSSRYGGFSFTEETFKQIIDNFNNNVYGSELEIGLPFDTEHYPELGAVGWIKNVYMKDSEYVKNRVELWGEVEWTPLGVKLIKEKRYKYVSISVYPKFEDHESGEKFENVMAGAAITVDPFIKGMEPLSLSMAMENAKMDNSIEEIDDSIVLNNEQMEEKEEKTVSLKTEKIEAKLTEIADIPDIPVIATTSKNDFTEEVNSLRIILSKKEESFNEVLKTSEEMKLELSKVAEEKMKLEKEIEVYRNLNNEFQKKIMDEKMNSMNLKSKTVSDGWVSNGFFKNDVIEKVNSFMLSLMKMDEKIELSEEETAGMADKFVEIVNSFSVQKNEDLFEEVGHSRVKTLNLSSNVKQFMSKDPEERESADEEINQKVLSYQKSAGIKDFNIALSEMLDKNLI